MTPDYMAYVANAGNPALLVDQLNLVLMSQSMSPELRTRIINGISSIPTTRTNWQLDRVKNAVWLIALSPEFVIQK